MFGNTEGKSSCSKYMDTKQARIARKNKFTKRQQEIIIGSLLGDGHLAKTTRGFAFRANHGINQSEYVHWKHKELVNFTNSTPCVYKKTIYFRTVSHDFFDDLHQIFYADGVKIISENLFKWLTPLSFSVWIMDDGSRDGKQLRINSQSFSKEENQKLIHILEAKFGIKATLNRDKNYYRLRIADDSMGIVKNITREHLIPSMLYKISP